MKREELYTGAVRLLKDLIAIKSYSKEEKGTADRIEEYFKSSEIKFERKGNNVWARSSDFDAGKPTILLNSHHDTVKPNAGWTLDPFTPVEKNGKLFGLGSNDAGGALVSLIASFRHFYGKTNLPFNLIIAATAEEENSGENGIRAILSELGKIDGAIVGEPTEMRMAVAEKGLMVIDCLAKGKAGHAAREVGINAISEAVKDIDWFHSYQFPKISEVLGPVKMTCTIIQAGSLHNVIPDECRFTIDVRPTDVYSNEEILEVIRTRVKSECQPRSTHLNASGIDPRHPLVRAANQLGIETFGSATSSDMPHIKAPAVKLGPGKSERSHTADEFIYLDEIRAGIDGYIALLEALFTNSNS